MKPINKNYLAKGALGPSEIGACFACKVSLPRCMLGKKNGKLFCVDHIGGGK